MNDFEITLKKFEIQSIKSPVVEIIHFEEFGHKKKLVLTFEESTIDHYIPKSKGGSNALENLRISCRECNLSKADQMPMNNE